MATKTVSLKNLEVELNLNLSRWACKIGSRVTAVSESPPTGDIPDEELLPIMLTSLTASATQSLAFACP